MDHDDDRGTVGEAAGILKRLGRFVKGRLREFAAEKKQEAKQTLREVREELDEEIRSTEK